MNKIKWSPYRDLDENANWVGTWNGEFVEVVKIANLWHGIFKGTPVACNCKTRKEAVDHLEEAFK